LASASSRCFATFALLRIQFASSKGVKGLFWDPVRGAKNGRDRATLILNRFSCILNKFCGVAAGFVGFVKGLGKGVMGLVTKPASGHSLIESVWL
jgi:hypothetical protein